MLARATTRAAARGARAAPRRSVNLSALEAKVTSDEGKQELKSLIDAGSLSAGALTAASLYLLRLIDPIDTLLEELDELRRAEKRPVV